MDLNRIAEFLESGDDSVRREALVALGKLRASEAIDSILAMIENKKLAPHLPELFDALVSCGSDVDLLITLAGSRRPRLQIEGARSLGMLGDSAAVPLLEKRLTSKRPELQEAAQVALERIRTAGEPTGALEPSSEGGVEAALTRLSAGDADALPGVLGFLREREGSHDGPRPPEDPRSALEIDVVEEMTKFAAVRREHLVTVADALHDLRRGRFGCSVGAEFAAKRGLEDLTGTAQISAYDQWREGFVGGKAAEGDSESATASIDDSVQPTPAVTRASAPPSTSPEPEAAPAESSEYWERPPKRKKPWWKFW